MSPGDISEPGVSLEKVDYLDVKTFSGDRLTVCKTVRPMLSDRCPVLSVMLVYCGQTVGWIQMKLGMQVGRGPGHIVLDGDPATLPKMGRSPPFLLWPNGWMHQDATC